MAIMKHIDPNNVDVRRCFDEFGSYFDELHPI